MVKQKEKKINQHYQFSVALLGSKWRGKL